MMGNLHQEISLVDSIPKELVNKNDFDIYKHLKAAILGLGICEEKDVIYFLAKYVEYSNINNIKNYWLNIEGKKIPLIKVKNTFTTINKDNCVECVCDIDIIELR